MDGCWYTCALAATTGVLVLGRFRFAAGGGGCVGSAGACWAFWTGLGREGKRFAAEDIDDLKSAAERWSDMVTVYGW